MQALIMKLFKRKSKYLPPNPYSPTEFTSAGGWEIYKMLSDLHSRVGRLEGQWKILAGLVVGLLVLILAKLYGLG